MNLLEESKRLGIVKGSIVYSKVNLGISVEIIEEPFLHERYQCVVASVKHLSNDLKDTIIRDFYLSTRTELTVEL